jgi:hypothetical protein
LPPVPPGFSGPISRYPRRSASSRWMLISENTQTRGLALWRRDIRHLLGLTTPEPAIFTAASRDTIRQTDKWGAAVLRRLKGN